MASLLVTAKIMILSKKAKKNEKKSSASAKIGIRCSKQPYSLKIFPRWEFFIPTLGIFSCPLLSSQTKKSGVMLSKRIISVANVEPPIIGNPESVLRSAWHYVQSFFKSRHSEMQKKSCFLFAFY